MVTSPPLHLTGEAEAVPAGTRAKMAAVSRIGRRFMTLSTHRLAETCPQSLQHPVTLPVMPIETTVEEVRIHGHQVRYRTASSDPDNPVLLLVHGIAGSSQTWEEVIPALARDYTVIAPDLLGHGESAKPRGDYSLGAYASGLRDLLAVLGHDRATVVGHSLGGGIAMV